MYEPQRDPSTITPFIGTVTVSFSDAIIGSSKNAKLLSIPGKDPVYFLPFEDVYFDFLTQTAVADHDQMGIATYWSVNAVGEAADNFMWSYEAPEQSDAILERHAAFNPRKARIEAVPAEDGKHTPDTTE